MKSFNPISVKTKKNQQIVENAVMKHYVFVRVQFFETLCTMKVAIKWPTHPKDDNTCLTVEFLKKLHIANNDGEEAEENNLGEDRDQEPFSIGDNSLGKKKR